MSSRGTSSSACLFSNIFNILSTMPFHTVHDASFSSSAVAISLIANSTSSSLLYGYNASSLLLLPPITTSSSSTAGSKMPSSALHIHNASSFWLLSQQLTVPCSQDNRSATRNNFCWCTDATLALPHDEQTPPASARLKARHDTFGSRVSGYGTLWKSSPTFESLCLGYFFRGRLGVGFGTRG